MPFDSAAYYAEAARPMTLKQALTLTSFRGWLESLDPSTKLGVFTDIHDCAIARYLRATGVEFDYVGGTNVDGVSFTRHLRAAQRRAQVENVGWMRGKREITAGEYLAAVNSK